MPMKPVAIDYSRLRSLVGCRICWRIAFTVFLSILAVETAILIPSYDKQEKELLLRLEEEARATAIVGFAINARTSTLDPMANGAVVAGSSRFRGIALYGADGRLIGTSGDAPELTLAEARDSQVSRVRRADGERYEVLWTARETGLPVSLIGRLDATWVTTELAAYVWRILGLVLVISLFVSVVTIFIVGRLVLRPMLGLRAHLLAARQDPAHADRYTLVERNGDELGEIVEALNELLRHVTKTYRDALRESEERFRVLINYSPTKIHIKDTEGRYILINKLSEELFGVTDEEARGHTSKDIFSEDMANAFGAHDQAVLDTGKAVEAEEEFLREGRVHTFLTVKFPIKNSDGEVTSVGSVGTDITERKQAERALLVAKEEAELANRAKSEFLANMSHELRTPLNAVIGFAQIIQGSLPETGKGPKLREYAGDIASSGQHLLELINDILDLSKIEAGTEELQEEAVEVTEVIGSCISMIKPRAESNELDLITEVVDGLPALYADGRKLRQILINLLSNAVKFTPSGGTVTVRAWHRAKDGHVFQIADTGIGIALEDIPKALARFGQIEDQLNRNYEGTGLGLSLTKSLVELHGGSLDLQSTLGVGTTVTVRFPEERVLQRVDEANPAEQDLQEAS